MACAGADKARSTPASEDSEDTLWKVSSVLSDACLKNHDLVGITCNNTASVFWWIGRVNGPNGHRLINPIIQMGLAAQVSIEEELSTPFESLQTAAASQEDRKAAAPLRSPASQQTIEQPADLDAAALTLHRALISLAAAHQRSRAEFGRAELAPNGGGTGAAVPPASDMAPGHPLSQPLSQPPSQPPENGAADNGNGPEPHQAMTDVEPSACLENSRPSVSHRARQPSEDVPAQGDAAAAAAGSKGAEELTAANRRSVGSMQESGSEEEAAGKPGSEAEAAVEDLDDAGPLPVADEEGLEDRAAGAAGNRGFRLAYALLGENMYQRTHLLSNCLQQNLTDLCFCTGDPHSDLSL